MNLYCNNSWKTIVEKLDSSIYKGLTHEECSKRRAKYGDNKVNLPYGKNNILSYIKEVCSIQLLIEIFILSLLTYRQEYIMASIIFLIVIFNISLKGLNTYRKQKQVAFLQNINYSTTTVLRDGVEEIVRAEELVVGDIVFFKKGSLIAADVRVIRAADIKVDEKNITGESFLKDKYESKIEGNISSIGQMKNIVFKGSVIREGEGAGIVIGTGGNTQLGKLLAMLTYANNKHVLGKKIQKKIGQVFLCLVILSISLFFIFNNYEQAFKHLTLSLFIIGIIPTELIIAFYIKLLKRDMMKEEIELINISTLDLINDLDIIFLDKVGSITMEKMVINSIYSNDKIYELNEINYKKDININRLIDIVLLCNDSTYNVDDDTGLGDLCEVAYLGFAAKRQIYKSILDSKYKRIFEVPMDSDKRILTTLNKYKKGCRANIKGNLDAVLDRCTHIMVDGIEKEITNEDIEKIKGIDFNYSLEGLTTQGVAYRSFNYQPSSSENIESNLVFVGIIALENPFNENMEAEIQNIKDRGIIPILFTEDNKIAATTIGKKAKIISSGSSVISGIELDSLSKSELIEVLSRVRVFSRVNPEIKGKIVGLFVKDDYSVGVAGETLGDLPSLSISKLGIGKGKSPQILKKVSDVYIKDNYLNKVLKIFDVAKSFRANSGTAFNSVISLIIAELIIANTVNLISAQKVLSIVPILIINIGMLIPMILVLLGVGVSESSIKKDIVRCVLWTSFTLVGIQNISRGVDVITLIILGAMIIAYILIASRVKIFKLNKESLLILFTILIWLIAIGAISMFNSLYFDIYNIIKAGILIIIYIIIELIMKRWQV